MKKIARAFYVKDLGKVQDEIEKLEKKEKASLESYQFFPIGVEIPDDEDKKKWITETHFAVGVTLNLH